MKEKLGSIIAGFAKPLGAIGTVLAGYDLIAPEDVAALNNAGLSMASAIALIIAAILCHVVGKLLKKSGGLPGGTAAFAMTATAWGMGLAVSLSSMSCSAVGSAITGQPVAGTAVQRAGHADSTPVLIASGDLAQAEAEAEASAKAKEKPAVHGLYDVGRAATAIREVFTESGK